MPDYYLMLTWIRKTATNEMYQLRTPEASRSGDRDEARTHRFQERMRINQTSLPITGMLHAPTRVSEIWYYILR